MRANTTKRATMIVTSRNSALLLKPGSLQILVTSNLDIDHITPASTSINLTTTLAYAPDGQYRSRNISTLLPHSHRHIETAKYATDLTLCHAFGVPVAKPCAKHMSPRSSSMRHHLAHARNTARTLRAMECLLMRLLQQIISISQSWRLCLRLSLLRRPSASWFTWYVLISSFDRLLSTLTSSKMCSRGHFSFHTRLKSLHVLTRRH